MNVFEEKQPLLFRILPRTYRLCQLLRPDISSSGQTRTVKVGYEKGHSLTNRKNESTPLKEIIVNVQRLAPLVPIDKVELLRTFINYEYQEHAASGYPRIPPSKMTTPLTCCRREAFDSRRRP